MDKLQRYVDQPIKWATIGGLVLLLTSLFGPWAKLDLGGMGEFAKALGLGDLSTNGFDHNGTLMLLLAVAGLVAIGIFTSGNTGLRAAVLLWALVGVALVIDLLVLLAFLDIAGKEGITFGWGVLLAIVSAVALSVGAIVPMWGEIRSRASQMGNTTTE